MRTNGIVLALSVLLGCRAPLLPYTLEVPAQTIRPLGTPDAMDGRHRFREIFCTLLARENGYETGPHGCEKQLHRLADEAPVTNPLVSLPPHDPRTRVLIVPGLFGECVADVATPFSAASAQLRRQGIRVDPLIVSGRSSPDHNAEQIAEAIRSIDVGPQDRVVLLGHSKGAVDLLHFLVNHPDLSGRVDAVVSVAGAINGSPIADRMARHYERWLADLDVEECPPGDGGAIESLRRPVRLEWLATHSLPPDVPRFSVVAFTDRDQASPLMRWFWKELARIDPRNDGQLLFFDQVIPGATLLGYANADHLAVALPLVEQSGSVAAEAALGSAPYPRGVLLEAIILYVVEFLDGQAEEG